MSDRTPAAGRARPLETRVRREPRLRVNGQSSAEEQSVTAKTDENDTARTDDKTNDTGHAAPADARPGNLRVSLVPTDGYGLEIDGKMKSQHVSSDAAFRAGLELKKKFPLIQVKVFAAKEQTRTIVELPKA